MLNGKLIAEGGGGELAPCSLPLDPPLITSQELTLPGCLLCGLCLEPSTLLFITILGVHMVQIDALHEKEDYHILATLYQAGNGAFFRTGALRLSCYHIGVGAGGGPWPPPTI